MKHRKQKVYFVTKQVGKKKNEIIIAKFEEMNSAKKVMDYVKKHGYKSKYRVRVGKEIL